MNHPTTKILCAVRRLQRLASVALGSVILAGVAHAAVHGIKGPTFNLTAAAGDISQPDGTRIYSWGYGCNGAPPAGYQPSQAAGNCPSMQLPGPTMIVTEGDSVTVTLKNLLPPGAGATSIIFPGMTVSAAGGASGVLTQEAPNGATGNTVTYTFTAGKPGTYAYYSGSQPDLQIEKIGRAHV